MNERIKELIEQATARKWRGDGTDSIPKEEFDKEKFAELIVRECCNWIDNSPTTEDGRLILTKQFIIDNLKEHFGVEE